MVAECWVIMILIGAMVGIFVRRGAQKQGVAILPLLLVPFAFLIAGPLSRSLASVFSFVAFAFLRICITLVGLVAACVLFGLLSGNMGGRRTQKAYMILCSGFSVILTIVLINSMLKI